MTTETTGARGNAGSFRASGSYACDGDHDRSVEDHYATLGVPESASPEAIRAAYLALIKRNHPDRAADPSAGAAATALNQAMAVLGDPKRRRAYDHARRPPMASGPLLFPLVVPPPRRGIARGWALGIIAASLAVATGLVLTARPPVTAPFTASLALAARSAAPVVDRLLVQTVVQQAAVDLDWIALYGGADGAERFSRNCYQELGRGTSPALLLFCAAADARGARLFPRRLPYFGTGQRQARFLRAARLLPLPVAELWRCLEAETHVLDRAGSRVRPASAALPGTRDGDRIEILPDP